MARQTIGVGWTIYFILYAIVASVFLVVLVALRLDDDEVTTTPFREKQTDGTFAAFHLLVRFPFVSRITSLYISIVSPLLFAVIIYLSVNEFLRGMGLRISSLILFVVSVVVYGFLLIQVTSSISRCARDPGPAVPQWCIKPGPVFTEVNLRAGFYTVTLWIMAVMNVIVSLSWIISPFFGISTQAAGGGEEKQALVSDAATPLRFLRKNV